MKGLWLSFIVFVLAVSIGLAGCSKGGSSSGSGDASCDTVANADGPGYLKVINNLSTGLEWYLQEYAFGADMKPSECTIFGVAAGTHTVKLTQCNIADAACTSTFGSTISKNFSVADGETYTITVSSNFF